MSKTPKVRFKGFSGEWSKNELGDIVEFFAGLTYSPTNITATGTLVLRSSNVKNGEVINSDNVYVNPKVVNCDNVQHGDVIVVVRNGSRSLIGKHAQIKKEMPNTVIGAFMTGVRHEVPAFLNALLDTEQFNIEIEKDLGATINQITTGSFKKMEFVFPTEIPEQTKIGNFFKEVDSLIAKREQKLDKLQKMKRALLEKMFPQNTATTPQVRFNGFEDEWSKLKIDSFCKIGTGKSNTQDQVDDGKYPFFIRSDIPVKSNKYLYDCEAVITIGDGNIGKVFHYVNGKFDLHQRCYKMTDFIDMQGRYFYHYFSTHFYVRAMQMTAKATVDSVRLEMISEMDVLKPNRIEEQEKISKLLDNLDNLISLSEKELEKLKNIKKSLLGKMFV